jgi:hypothetical protein
MGKSVLKELRFQLTLDDPKLPKDNWVTLEGDRAQLEALYEAVSSYVQGLLQYPGSARMGDFVQGEAITTLDRERGRVQLTSPPTLASMREIRLQPSGLLSHEIVLGSLANSATGAVTHLSTLQLFDLANALDEFSTEIETLPELPTQRTMWHKSSWAQLAAIALVVVGLSTSVVRLMGAPHSARRSPSVPTDSQGANSSDQKIATQLPPSAAGQMPTSPLSAPPPPPPGSLGNPSPAALPRVTVPPAIAPSASAPSSAGNRVATLPQEMKGDSRSQVPVLPSSRSLKPEFSNPTSAKPAIGTMMSRADSPASSSTAFDTIPQVAEARQYFQQRWKPPQGLNQTLEYTLVVGSNGSIQQILPLGQASGDYVDRTPIPLTGEPFVSAIEGKRNARIRVVLSPDGKVQTFLEQLY